MKKFCPLSLRRCKEECYLYNENDCSLSIVATNLNNLNIKLADIDTRILNVNEDLVEALNTNSANLVQAINNLSANIVEALNEIRDKMPEAE